VDTFNFDANNGTNANHEFNFEVEQPPVEAAEEQTSSEDDTHSPEAKQREEQKDDKWTSQLAQQYGKYKREARAKYLTNLLSTITVNYNKSDLFMLPVPAEVGNIQCVLDRNKRGLNKLWPKFELLLLDGEIDVKLCTKLLSANKIKKSKTAHYRIQLGNSDKDEAYIGRLRGNADNSQFYIFDTGPNYAEATKLQKPQRRQLGTIIYKTDKFKTKGSRHIDAYFPQPLDNSDSCSSWPEAKDKSSITFEYSKQLLKQKTLEKKGQTIGNDPENPAISLFESASEGKMKIDDGSLQDSRKNF
jgi:hypothetical protein